MEMLKEEISIHRRPVDLLQQLIRFDTTNPPGNEAECINYIDSLLKKAGIQTTILAQKPVRPNLMARIAGRGDAPPLLIYAHIDVVGVEGQNWQYPPFEGRIVDGWIWGRGAFDDKGGAAMSLCAFLRAKAEGLVPPGDVILAILCDEEERGGFGARYLVENHPDLFAGVRYAIGEAGGFNFTLGGHRFYPIMVAEKQGCRIQATVRGPGVHAAVVVVRGGAAAKLGAMLTRLDKARLPVHVTPVVRQMFEIISSNVPFPTSLVLRQLLNPILADKILDLLGPTGQALYPLLHNSFNVIEIRGEKIAREKDEVTAFMLAKLLPGFSPDDMLAELRPIIGDEVELEVTFTGEPIPAQADFGLFDLLGEVLREADPQGVPVPLLLAGSSDARFFDRLGIQTYGYRPMNLPPGFDVARLAHATDERVPVEGMEFGTESIYKVLRRFGE